jgi:anti-sigma28 factor (negative regulator of flagellin synthesis)
MPRVLPVLLAMESPDRRLARGGPGGFLIWSDTMSSINGLGGTSPLQQTQTVTPKTINATEATATPKASLSDRLELSGVSNLFASLKANDIRTDKVADIKSQIANGSYDADGSKLDAATNKLLDELNG